MIFRLFRRVALAVLAVFLLSGCEAALRVGIDTNDKGGGRVVAIVTLDPDAQKIVGDLTGKLRTGDLTAAGWKVVGPEKVDDDVRITATKNFSSPAGVAQAVRELDGDGGIFKDFKVTQSKSLLQTKTNVRGTVDLRRGLEAFSDEELRAKLGSPLGASDEEFAARIGRELSEALPITVGVLMPGEVESNAPIEDGGSAAWRPKLGDRIELVATSKKWNTLVIGLGAVSVVALGAALIFGVGRRRTPVR